MELPVEAEICVGERVPGGEATAGPTPAETVVGGAHEPDLASQIEAAIVRGRAASAVATPISGCTTSGGRETVW